LRELVRASRNAEIKGHGPTRTVRCPYCHESFKRTIIPHIKKNHSKKWQQWQTDMLKMYNEGLSSVEIARECFFLFTWSLVEKQIVKISEERGVAIAPPLKKSIKEWNSSDELQRTTVWKFGKRGTWAVHEGKYRGNYPPQVPNDIIRRYTSEGDLVLDPFLGGGTTVFESWLLNRKSIGIDISPHAISISKKRISEMEKKAPKGKLIPSFKPVIYQRDARDLGFLEKESTDLVCTQPPYLNAIKYTEYYPNDLSHIEDGKKFCQEFGKVAQELFRVLRKGKICAVQIGDTRKDGEFVPLGFMIFNELITTGFRPKNIITKLQYADKSKRFYRNLKELQIAHEYIFITKKP